MRETIGPILDTPRRNKQTCEEDREILLRKREDNLPKGFSTSQQNIHIISSVFTYLVLIILVVTDHWSISPFSLKIQSNSKPSHEKTTPIFVSNRTNFTLTSLHRFTELSN